MLIYVRIALTLLLVTADGLCLAKPIRLALKNQLTHTTADSSRSRLLWQLGKEYAELQPDSGLYFLNQSLQIASRSHDAVATARAMCQLGWTNLYFVHDESQTVQWANKAIAVAKPQNDYLHLAGGFRLLGIVAYHQHTTNYHELLARAVDYAKKANDWQELAHVYTTMSDIYVMEKKYAQAETFLLQAMSVCRQHDLDNWFTNGLAYCELLESQGKHAQSRSFARKLTLVAPRLPKTTGDFVYTNDMARLAILLTNYTEAETLLLKGIEGEKQTPKPDPRHLYFFYKNLIDVYTKQGDYQKAFQVSQQLGEVKLSLQRIRQTRDTKLQMTELKAALDLEKKQTEITLLTTRQQQQRLLLLAVASVAVLLIGFALVLLRTQRRINRQRTELTQLNTTKDKLFAILSHDLRSPVANLENNVMLTNWGALSQAEFTESTRQLGSSIGHLRTMLDNLLHWAFSQMEGMKARPERVALPALVQEQIDLLQPIANAKRVQIDQQMPADTYLTADRNHLGVIIRNLLQNALKFTPAGGRVWVSYSNANGKVMLKVQDTGIGMDPATVATLFQLNKTVSRPGTAHEPGTGLGLVLVRELLAANGGQISVASTPKQGTTFTLLFQE